jgi:GH25 family lysozyme M1 (1,4-beta-N-acetylmuramidase)
MRKSLVRLLFGVLALVLAGVVSACGPVSSSLGTTGPMSGPYAKTIWGVDVSNYQHPYGAGINWSAVRASGARFAFVKVSEGNWYANPYQAGDISAARAAGLDVGGYHFARPRLPLSTAVTDAKTFASQLGNVRQPGMLPPVLDVETTGGLSGANVTAWVRSFLSTLEPAVGRTPMIYSGAWFWQGYMGNPMGFSHYPVWVAQYTPGDTGPNLFSDYSYSTFWQYSGGSYVPGISGAVDADWFHGSQAQLNSLAWGATNQSSARALYDRVAGPTGPPAASQQPAGPSGSRMAQDPGVLGH